MPVWGKRTGFCLKWLWPYESNILEGVGIRKAYYGQKISPVGPEVSSGVFLIACCQAHSKWAQAPQAKD